MNDPGVCTCDPGCPCEMHERERDLEAANVRSWIGIQERQAPYRGANRWEDQTRDRLVVKLGTYVEANDLVLDCIETLGPYYCTVIPKQADPELWDWRITKRTASGVTVELLLPRGVRAIVETDGKPIGFTRQE
jgi:hypothetical protein